MDHTPPIATAAALAAPGSVPCTYCKAAEVGAGEKFCAACGYPQGGTYEEQDAFKYAQARQRYAKEVSVQQVTRARNTLYWVAGLTFVPYAITYAVSREPVILIEGFVLGAIYVGLALWSRTKPFPALLTALVLFIAINLLAIVIDPMNIARGLVVKVIVLSSLIYALRSLKRGNDVPVKR